ncbi:MAG TPA: hypothetical protein VMD55_10500 [Terracidiphilus sp.]|nr:hypothetical protein [Terracidiphilus sp.]
MVVNPAAFRSTRRITFALGLCLLALVFAVEAKTAWYGPAKGPEFDVRAAKARPADLPQVIDHGVPVPNPVPPLLSFAVLAVLKTGPFAGQIRPSPDQVSPAGGLPAARLSPQLYFRPPPSSPLPSVAS